MVIVLLKVIFWTVSTAADVINLALFRAAAVVIVLAVQCMKAPAGALVDALNFMASFARLTVEKGVDLLVETVFSAVSQAVKHLPEITSRGTVGRFLLEIGPEAAQSVAEMVHSIIHSFLQNYKEAIAYIMKNI
ncbi:unnamed protein product [Spirodela intermedia]|uniref:Uncharacterized protein n=1 Tax=Spirodela intermedia TaxID=51605 RepID=A0A7I8IRT2_SPIIN|nr:unnamed protein product [Spirodela intermedia]CAA6659874.1 unnamed protein product [Spirodela intermedia]